MRRFHIAWLAVVLLFCVAALIRLAARKASPGRASSTSEGPPVLFMSMCDGRWKRYSVPDRGAATVRRLQSEARGRGLSRVVAHCESDLEHYEKKLPFSEAWDRNWLECGHVQKLLFILEHRALIESWPGVVLYQDCKNGHLGAKHIGSTRSFRDFAAYLDEAGGFLAAHQPYKHRDYSPEACSLEMGRDVSSEAYASECQIRTAWMLFRPSRLHVFDAALDVLANGHPACRCDGDDLYGGVERGRGDQTVIHNVLFRMGLDKHLSAYDSSGRMQNSVFFFDYFDPEWTLVLERAVC